MQLPAVCVSYAFAMFEKTTHENPTSKNSNDSHYHDFRHLIAQSKLKDARKRSRNTIRLLLNCLDSLSGSAAELLGGRLALAGAATLSLIFGGLCVLLIQGAGGNGELASKQTTSGAELAQGGSLIDGDAGSPADSSVGDQS